MIAARVSGIIPYGHLVKRGMEISKDGRGARGGHRDFHVQFQGYNPGSKDPDLHCLGLSRHVPPIICLRNTPRSILNINY
jgi:hypothetical protein